MTNTRMYLACTRCKRGDAKALFISSLISQFLVEQLAMDYGCYAQVGINVELFWPHSTSAVATSKASVYSVLLDQILSTSEWSSGSTFAKFCN